MSGVDERERGEDEVIDAVAAVILVLIPVLGIIYWLSGLPTS